MRQILLDTETTGLEPTQGHRIIEIGCVELVNRRLTGNDFHLYLNPEREIDEGATEVHGMRLEDLADKPLFGDIVDDLLEYVDGAELIIHNAPFDVGFLNNELRRAGHALADIALRCQVTDTLAMARRMHPGQKNSLDALCKRYGIDNSQRQLHGALLDAQILADVYLAMTGGQATLLLDEAGGEHGVSAAASGWRQSRAERPPLRVVRADAYERAAHEARLDAIERLSGTVCVWRRGEGG